VRKSSDLPSKCFFELPHSRSLRFFPDFFPSTYMLLSGFYPLRNLSPKFLLLRACPFLCSLFMTVPCLQKTSVSGEFKRTLKWSENYVGRFVLGSSSQSNNYRRLIRRYRFLVSYVEKKTKPDKRFWTSMCFAFPQAVQKKEA